MRIKRISVIAAVVSFGIFSCTRKNINSPGFEYMPDMYRNTALKYYSFNMVNGDTIWGAELPPQNTIARGYKPFPYPNTGEGYELAGQNLKNPIPYSPEVVKQGEELYGKYCVHCHGATGQGDGKVAAKLPGPPPPYTSPNLMALPEGKMFHAITYGKGLMGSHNFLSTEERWKLIHFIHELQGKHKELASATVTDSTKTNNKKVK